MIVTEKRSAKEFAGDTLGGIKNFGGKVGNSLASTGIVSTGAKEKRAAQTRNMNRYWRSAQRHVGKDEKKFAKDVETYNKREEKRQGRSDNYWKAVAGGKNAAKVAGALGAIALMTLAIKKILKNDPNSAVAKEAAKRVKVLEKEIKMAQKELKKAKTPAEAKAAEKKINAAEKKLSKLKTQIGRLADKNLSPKEVEKLQKQLQKMIAESVAPAYTEAELMFTGIQTFTESIMEDHYYALMMEAAEEADELEDIFGEDADDFDDDFFEDADDFDFDEFEESAEDDLFDDFDFDF